MNQNYIHFLWNSPDSENYFLKFDKGCYRYLNIK